MLWWGPVTIWQCDSGHKKFVSFCQHNNPKCAAVIWSHLTYSKTKDIVRKVSLFWIECAQESWFSIIIVDLAGWNANDVQEISTSILALLPHNIRLHNQHIWQQINTNKLTKVLRLIIELHIYGLVGVVTSLSVFFIEVNTTFPPPLPVFVGNGALSLSNVCGLFGCSFQFLPTSENPAFKSYSTVL